MRIRELARHELDDLWSIDRRERIDAMFRVEKGELVRVPEHHDVRGWPPGEPERDVVLLADCFAHGGSFFGAFEQGDREGDAGERLIGAAVLESRFIGRDGDRLQLKFLHVSHGHRASGVGRVLFARAVARARELGARRLYVSATPSENTVRFYLRRGCHLADEIDDALFALEPEDIHLELEIDPA